MPVQKTRATRAAMVGSLAMLSLGAAVAAEEKLDIVYTNHSAATQPFAQAVKKGFDDACARIQANCQMVFTQDEGSLPQQISNQQAVLSRKIDALLGPLIDNNAYIENLEEAKAKGVLVIAVNVDATAGPELALRQAFVGQNFVTAGRSLATRLSKLFPKTGPLRAIVGVNAPGQNWSEERARGILLGLEEFKKANPNRQVAIERLDTGTDGAVVADRVGAYIDAHPDTNAYFDTALWHSFVAQALRDRKIPPGKILLGGFDLVPQVLQMMKAGYIQAEVDQQPYAQGYLPVMQVYLAKRAGLHPANIDTGQSIITPDQVDSILPLSQRGLR